MQREKLITNIERKLLQLPADKNHLVGIDGIDCAGKSTFAKELAESLTNSGRNTILSSIDHFHRPRKERYAKGPLSPEGYYQDSFDYDKLKTVLLQPVKNSNFPVSVSTSVFNFRNNTEVESSETSIDEPTILIFEGVFLFRQELFDFWDFKIFIDITFDTSLKRGLSRDLELFGEVEATEEKYRKRYIPGQKLYLQEVNPTALADLVIDNNEVMNPGFSEIPVQTS